MNFLKNIFTRSTAPKTAPKGTRSARQPMFEPLEGRQLMSVSLAHAGMYGHLHEKSDVRTQLREPMVHRQIEVTPAHRVFKAPANIHTLPIQVPMHITDPKVIGNGIGWASLSTQPLHVDGISRLICVNGGSLTPDL